MKKISFIFLVLFFLQLAAQADDMIIVDVHRNIPLSDEDTIYKDFAISTNDSAGLKKNLVVNVKRRLMIKDANAKDVGDLETKVGQIRIIHVDKKIAIGREYKLFSRDEEVGLDQLGIMTGDRIDMTDSFTDSKPLKEKKKEREPTSQASAKVETAESGNSNSEKNAVEKPAAAEPLKIQTNPLATPEI